MTHRDDENNDYRRDAWEDEEKRRLKARGEWWPGRDVYDEEDEDDD